MHVVTTADSSRVPVAGYDDFLKWLKEEHRPPGEHRAIAINVWRALVTETAGITAICRACQADYYVCRCPEYGKLVWPMWVYHATQRKLDSQHVDQLRNWLIPRDQLRGVSIRAVNSHLHSFKVRVAELAQAFAAYLDNEQPVVP